MKKRVITISRQFGSRGHSIGAKITEQLKIPFYDKEVLDRIAAETEFSPAFIEQHSEYAPTNNSLLWNFAIRGTANIPNDNSTDMIYFTQAKIIKELADKESCVIIGRCSDYILRDREDCLHIFICADKEHRAKGIIERYGETDKPIEKRIFDKDTRRGLYYAHYTDRVWGAPENYHLTLNSGALGEGACVKVVLDIVRE